MPDMHNTESPRFLVFDREGLLERMGGDDELAGKIVETYLDDAARQIADLRRLALAQDLAAIYRRAHSLKSASGSAGACAVENAALRVERAAKEGKNEAIGLIDAIGEEFDRLCEDLKAHPWGGAMA
jgi:HPt (histidine-containing phosphotransfer) domain-containing protein